MGRFEVSSRVAKLVRERFLNTCVVCGTTEFTDVAHIYEDATRSAGASDRLVVLCPNHNQAEERSHGRLSPNLPLDLQPANLLAGARTNYWEGNYRLDYGKARIAAYLFEKQGCYSDAVDCLTESISALRPLRWGDWIAATICEVERLCLSRTVGVARRWLLLDRVALTLFDYARWSEAADVLSAAISLRERVITDFYDPQRLKFDKQAAFRRESLIKGYTGQLNQGKGVDNLLQRLDEEATALLKDHKYDAVVTHLDVARNLASARGDRDDAHEYSERVLEIRSKVSHKWALLEHLMGEAEYFAFRKDRSRTLYYAGEAMSLFSKYPAVLEPILDQTPKQLGIHERIERLGIDPGDLLAENIAVSPDIVEIALSLSEKEVVRIVRNIVGNGS
jgi:hypothetical protein